MRPILLAKLVLAIAFASAFTGCVTQRIAAPRASELLSGKKERERIPVKAFVLQSSDRPIEIDHDLRMLAGTSRLVRYPRQAREFLAQDLRDYVGATFRIDPSSDVVLTLRLDQAYAFWTMVDSGANLIPVVGVVTSVADSFRDVPFTFIADVTAEVRLSANEVTSTNVFVKNVESAPSTWESHQTHDDRYRRQLAAVRAEVFERLDRQLLPMWQGQMFVGKAAGNASGNTATLASELSRLDASLAEGKLTQEEHASLAKAVTERCRH